MSIHQDLSIYKQLLIFVVSYISNLFSALSGGGAGLIQLPALIFLGIPYYKALALHKVATVALGLGGSIRNFSTLKNNYQIVFELLIFGIPGVLIGSSLVNFLPEDYLYSLLALFSFGLGSYSLYKKSLGLSSVKKKVSLYIKIRFYLFSFFIGILNGAISSGTGLLVTLLLIKTFGIDFLLAISITFLSVGIFWNATGALALSRIGSLPLSVAIILIIGSFLGGLSGAHLSKLKGNILVKKSFTLICFLVGSTLLLKVLR